MKPLNILAAVAVSVVTVATLGAAHAQVRITEVAPWSSGNSPVAADWFEVTNFGAGAVSLSGWKMDDNSFSSATAVALNGVSTLNAGESAIFIESASPASIAATFVNNWFGGTAPAGLKIGTYTGAGVGLGSGGDGVILFDGSNVQQARVAFGASPGTSPFATFDNSAGLDGASVLLTTLSVVGVNGAFQVVNAGIGEIGSPGTIAAVPEPEIAAFLLAGLAFGGLARRRARKTAGRAGRRPGDRAPAESFRTARPA